MRRLNAQRSAGARNLGSGRDHQLRHGAPLTRSSCTGSAPSGWKINFEPKTVDRIAPNENKEVQALITPPAKAIAGDYVTTLRAAARGESPRRRSASRSTTSTMWGIVGVGAYRRLRCWS